MDITTSVLHVAGFVFLVCALLFMARVERALREFHALGQRLADAADRIAAREGDKPPRPSPPPASA